MPWSEVSVMDLRLEFVMLARQPGANVAALCRRFGISRKTGYKWLRRVGSRNPCRPSSTPPSIRSAASSMADGSASRARRSNCPRHSPDTRSVSCPPPATASGTSSSRAAISPNSTGDRAQQKLLPMSPNTCNPCLRSVHPARGRELLVPGSGGGPRSSRLRCFERLACRAGNRRRSVRIRYFERQGGDAFLRVPSESRSHAVHEGHCHGTEINPAQISRFKDSPIAEGGA